MSFICARFSRLNRITSSSRFRNSGRKAERTTAITCSRASLAGAPSGRAARYSEPRFEVRTIMRVPEIDRAALAIGEPAVVQHLQQDVEHVRVRLLDLVEQDHLVGPAADRLGQRTALLVADIARRRADQPGDGVLLHELRHVDPDHRLVVVEQERGDRLAQLGLADAGRAQEQERADRPVRVLQAGPGPAHGVGHRLERLLLADDAACAALSSMRSSLSRSPSSIRSTGMPVQRDTTWAMSWSVTSSSTMLLPSLRLGLLQLLLQLAGCSP